MHPLLNLAGLTPEAKARRISAHYPALHDHPSGIFYSLLKIDGDRIRPFGPADFIGIETFSFKGWRFPPEGPWEYRNNENSIATSGYWLAAQVERFLATGEADAKVQAARACASLEAIYRLGEADGQPGWLGKPYGFRLSDQTSGDQYLFAAWGLFSYLTIAPPEHAARIRAMLVGLADHWRRMDYKIYYLDRVWDNRPDQHAYNAIFTYLNTLAHHLTGRAEYLAEAREWRGRSLWDRETKLDAWKRDAANKAPHDWPPNRLVGTARQPDEYLCWETTIHSLFAAVSATGVHELAPELVDAAALAGTLEKWWEPWSLGVGDDLLPYYFFLLNLKTGAWRPAPRTPRLPRTEWFLSQPHLSNTNGKRWTEPLSRTLVTSVLAGVHAPRIAAPARSLARRILETIDATRLRCRCSGGHSSRSRSRSRSRRRRPPCA